MFYKIVYNNLILDILKNPVFVKYSFKSKRFLVSDGVSADGVMSRIRDEVYLFKTIDGVDNLKVITMIEIAENEYLSLLHSIVDESNIMSVRGYAMSIQEIRQKKIDEMNEVCHETILNGFDIVLSDGIRYHFSLQITDQLRISQLYNKAMAGETLLAWHSDDTLSRFYSVEDITAIHNKMEAFIEYHATYFNSLKNYIKNIQDSKALLDIEYGVDIPVAYQSDVLVSLLDLSESDG